MVSTKLSVTLEDSAPRTTDGLAATICPAEAVEIDMSVESPESRTWWQALAPFTPPAALMSETARPTPATAGGPRKARLPVSGRMPPTLNELALVALASHLSSVKGAVRVGARSVGVAVGAWGRCGGRPRGRPRVARGRAMAAVPGVPVAATGDQGHSHGGAPRVRRPRASDLPGGDAGSSHVVNLSS